MYMIIRYLDPWGLLLEKDHGVYGSFRGFLVVECGLEPSTEGLRFGCGVRL